MKQQIQGFKFNNSYPLAKRSNLFVGFCLSLCTKTQSCFASLDFSVSTIKRLCLSIMVSNWGCFIISIIIIIIIPGEWRALSLRVEWWWNSGPASVSLAWLGRKGTAMVKDYGSSTLNWRYWTLWVREDWEVASAHCTHPNFYYKA